MQNVKSVREIDIKDKRVLIRVDFNVPMDSELNMIQEYEKRFLQLTIVLIMVQNQSYL